MSRDLKYKTFGKVVEFRNGLNFGKESHGEGCTIIGVPDFKDRFTPDYESLDQINREGIVARVMTTSRRAILSSSDQMATRLLLAEASTSTKISRLCSRDSVFAQGWPLHA